MNSFTINAIGTLASDPELIARGDTMYARFCLVGKDKEGDREVTTSVWFVAFGDLADVIAKNARRGDTLIVEAQVRSSNWIDKQGEKQYDYSFVVSGFRFGAPSKEAA